MDRHNIILWQKQNVNILSNNCIIAQGGSDSGKSWWSQSEQRNKAQKYESALYHQSILSILNHKKWNQETVLFLFYQMEAMEERKKIET